MIFLFRFGILCVIWAILAFFACAIKRSAALHESDGRKKGRNISIPEWVYMLLFYIAALAVFSV